MADILECHPKSLSPRDAEFQKWAKALCQHGQEAQDAFDWREAHQGVQLRLEAPSLK